MNISNKSILKIIFAILTIALSAQVTIPLGSIPITGQTLSILIWAFFLSPTESFLALTLYLVTGFLGLPVFADGASGLDKLTSRSGGFLVGFCFSAPIVSYFYQKAKINALHFIITWTAIGTLIILVFGVGRLSMLYGFEKGLEYGFLPLWKGALIKIILGSIIVWLLKNKLDSETT